MSKKDKISTEIDILKGILFILITAFFSSAGYVVVNIYTIGVIQLILSIIAICVLCVFFFFTVKYLRKALNRLEEM